MFGGSNWWDAGCIHCSGSRTASPGAYAGEGVERLKGARALWEASASNPAEEHHSDLSRPLQWLAR
jgi:hypothetical protein